jgi:hypothetical protein
MQLVLVHDPLVGVSATPAVGWFHRSAAPLCIPSARAEVSDIGTKRV